MFLKFQLFTPILSAARERLNSGGMDARMYGPPEVRPELYWAREGVQSFHRREPISILIDFTCITIETNIPLDALPDWDCRIGDWCRGAAAATVEKEGGMPRRRQGEANYFQSFLSYWNHKFPLRGSFNLLLTTLPEAISLRLIATHHCSRRLSAVLLSYTKRTLHALHTCRAFTHCQWSVAIKTIDG